MKRPQQKKKGPKEPGPVAKAEPSPVEPPRPLKPRPILFAGLLLLFALWIGVLLTLYFKTVYPLRHGGQSATPPPSSRGT